MITAPGESLSNREKQVCALIRDGRSNKEIAAAMGLTLGTAKGYVFHVLHKTGSGSRLELAVTMLSQELDAARAEIERLQTRASV